MNLANAKIGQLMIPVDDFDKGIAFYRDILGLPFLFAAPPQMAFFDCSGVRLLVGVMPPGQKAQRGSAIYFRVPDIHSVFSSLKQNGVASWPILTSCIGRRKPSFGWRSSTIRTGINWRS